MLPQFPLIVQEENMVEKEEDFDRLFKILKYVNLISAYLILLNGFQDSFSIVLN
jgi:hypothetical protein